jgi:acetyl esterase/lipase
MSFDVSTLFLFVSLVGAAFTTAALVRVRRVGPLLVPWFFAGWLTSELSLFHVAWQAAATVAFAAAGAMDEARGVVALAITFVSWGGLLFAHTRSAPAEAVFESALVEAFGPDYRRLLPADREAILRHDAPASVVARPFSMRRPGVERVRNIAYGDAGHRHMLDVYHPSAPGSGRPVLFQIHGGAWMMGKKDEQALPLMNHLTERGWVCVALNYRLSPKVRFPDHLIDCKRALAWVREHIHEYGGDPNFIAVTGGSAGGHLTSLVALTPNRPELQPGFEEVDTSVAAAVPFYGVYDFLDRRNARGNQKMAPFLEKTVMRASPAADPEVWELASPVSQVNADAPPFLVIHGTHDSLAFVEDAQHFVEALRAVSRAPVAYAELPGAQHAFDIFHSVRSAHTVNAVARFLEVVHAGYVARAEAPLAIAEKPIEPATATG